MHSNANNLKVKLIMYNKKRGTSNQKTESDVKVNILAWCGATTQYNNYTKRNEPSMNKLKITVKGCIVLIWRKLI